MQDMWLVSWGLLGLNRMAEVVVLFWNHCKSYSLNFSTLSTSLFQVKNSEKNKVVALSYVVSSKKTDFGLKTMQKEKFSFVS